MSDTDRLSVRIRLKGKRSASKPYETPTAPQQAIYYQRLGWPVDGTDNRGPLLRVFESFEADSDKEIFSFTLLYFISRHAQSS